MQLRITTTQMTITQSSYDEEEWIFKILKPKGVENWFSLRASEDYIRNTYENQAVSITHI